MITIALVVAMLAGTVACVALGERLRLPYPVLMLVFSGLVAFVPGLPHLTVDPEVILPLFLPPLLFATAQHTSWGVFRTRWRSLLILALGLTAVTAFAVAGLSWLLIPGIAFPLALMLGAMVAPPDPVAVEAVSEPAKMPRRLLTVLQTEGLFNDAVAIVLFQAALVAVTAGEDLSPFIAVEFLVGGILAVVVGFVVGFLYRVVDRAVHSVAARTAIGVVTPFAAYMLAEEVHASGVIAVVVAALETRRNARPEDGEARMMRTSFWNVANLLVTGLAFGLIGVELRDVLAEERDHLLSYALIAILVAVLVIVIRMLAMLVLHVVSRRDGNALPRTWREGLVLTWCGMRGLATLALALAIPAQDAAGNPITDRNLLIVIACTALVVTLVPTGVLLPSLLRVLCLQDDGTANHEAMRELGERAQVAALSALRDRLPELHMPEDQKTVLIQRMKRLRADLAPSPFATGQFTAVDADGKPVPGVVPDSVDDDPEAARLRREKMRAARDMMLTAQTVALDAARAEVLAARREPGIDPAAADVVLLRLDRRMMAVPPRPRTAARARGQATGSTGRGGRGARRR
ncbi:cation:proton antiporter [Brachybacterium sp. AOP25-B2-12]|uniref:cation:proton antiporter n=1 Tax=Brachybacterium sp. AOP25-B2-12 TaxID=3457710 RepID=UPI0040333C7C